MTSAAESTGDLTVALSHAAKLLENDAALAAEQAAEILRVVPGHPMAQLVAGVAARRLGNAERALALLEPLAAAQPKAPAAHFELALVYGDLGRGEAAIAALRRAVALKPDLADAWRTLGDHLIAIGDSAGADAAYASQIKAATRDARLLAPAAALQEGRIAVAEALLREHLRQHPTDVAALRMLAEVAGRLGRYADAELLLTRCLELAPSFLAARHNLALVLTRQNRAADALAEARHLLDEEPRNPGYRNLMAAIQSQLGEYDRVDPALRRRARGLPEAAEGLDELRPRLEDRGPHRGVRRGLSQGDRDRAAARRSLVEPREPQDLSLHSRRRRDDAAPTRSD